MNLPAHLANRQSRNLAAQAIGGINQGSPAHISIAGNRFTLVDEAGNEKPIQTLFLDVCVIDANQTVSKIYFDPRVPFEPGGDNSNPPICWSDNGIGASAQASQPQNTSCQLCPQNAWGSSVSKATGKPVKACNDVKKVAVVVPGIEMTFLLRIPPASLKNWGKYCNTLAGHGVDLPDCFTRLEFESQGILKFAPAVQSYGSAYIDAGTAAYCDKVLEAKGTDQLIGRNDRPWGGHGEQQKLAYAQQQNLPPPTPSAPAQPMAPPPQPFGNQGVPVAQPSASPFGSSATPASSFNHSPAGSDPFGGQPGTSSSPMTPPKRTRGPNKPKEQPVQIDGRGDQGGGFPSSQDDGIPPFLRRTEGAPAQPVAPVNPTQFGMQQNPPAPDAGVQAALDAAFRVQG